MFDITTIYTPFLTVYFFKNSCLSSHQKAPPARPTSNECRAGTKEQMKAHIPRVGRKPQFLFTGPLQRPCEGPHYMVVQSKKPRQKPQCFLTSTIFCLSKVNPDSTERGLIIQGQEYHQEQSIEGQCWLPQMTSKDSPNARIDGNLEPFLITLKYKHSAEKKLL